MATLILIYVVILATLLGLAMTKDLEAALPFFTFAATLLPVDAQIQLPGLFTLTTQRASLILLIILYFIKKPKAARERKTSLPLRGLIALSVLWLFLSTLESATPAISWKAFLSQLLDFYVLYFIMFRCITKMETVKKILYAMVLAVVVCSVCGYFEAYFGWHTLSLLPAVAQRFGALAGLDMGRGNRVQTTFPHAILYGAALAMCIPFTLYFIGEARTKLKKFFLWFCVCLMFLNIYKTQSRGPWIALGLSMIILFIFAEGKIKKSLSAIAVLVVLVLVIRPGVWDTITSMYVATMDPDSPLGESYQYRYALRDLAKKELAKSTSRSLWGYGLESFYYLHLMGLYNGKEVPFESCDSSWVEIAVETGYVGLVLMAALLGAAMLITLRGFLAFPKPRDSLALILAVNMGSYYFMMLSVAIYGWGQPGYMLWILISVAMAHHRFITETAKVKDSSESIAGVPHGSVPALARVS